MAKESFIIYKNVQKITSKIGRLQCKKPNFILSFIKFTHKKVKGTKVLCANKVRISMRTRSKDNRLDCKNAKENGESKNLP